MSMSVKWHMFAASKALSSMRDKAAILKFFVVFRLGPGINKTGAITLHTIWTDIWTVIHVRSETHPLHSLFSRYPPTNLKLRESLGVQCRGGPLGRCKSRTERAQAPGFRFSGSPPKRNVNDCMSNVTEMG